MGSVAISIFIENIVKIISKEVNRIKCTEIKIWKIYTEGI